VLYGLTRATAEQLLLGMSGLTAGTFDELAQSAVGKLANMISGRAATLLEALDYAADITPPILIIGRGARISSAADRHKYAEIDTPHDPILIDIGIND